LLEAGWWLTEATEPRNISKMKAVVKKGALPSPLISKPIVPIIPGTEVSENPLPAIPARPISESFSSEDYTQSGGNPWAAFLTAFRSNKQH